MIINNLVKYLRKQVISNLLLVFEQVQNCKQLRKDLAGILNVRAGVVGTRSELTTVSNVIHRYFVYIASEGSITQTTGLRTITLFSMWSCAELKHVDSNDFWQFLWITVCRLPVIGFFGITNTIWQAVSLQLRQPRVTYSLQLL